jgi:hypothetical protein
MSLEHEFKKAVSDLYTHVCISVDSETGVNRKSPNICILPLTKTFISTLIEHVNIATKLKANLNNFKEAVFYLSEDEEISFYHILESDEPALENDLYELMYGSNRVRLTDSKHKYIQTFEYPLRRSVGSIRIFANAQGVYFDGADEDYGDKFSSDFISRLELLTWLQDAL